MLSMNSASQLLCKYWVNITIGDTAHTHRSHSVQRCLMLGLGVAFCLPFQHCAYSLSNEIVSDIHPLPCQTMFLDS